MASQQIVIVGRSSSHFTRLARIFAVELGVPHELRVVRDLTTCEPADYAHNPALKIPVLLDERGALFGAENICRALADRSGTRDGVVLRGDSAERLVANAEELILHAMSAEVTLILSAMPGSDGPPPPKVRRSLENTLGFLEAHVDALRAALPAARVLSFCEAALFCLVTHLPFRKIMDVSHYGALQSFCREFEQRAGARATTYRFDSA